MEYKLKSGRVLTDEEIERMALEYENGTWEGGLSDIHIGRPPISSDPLGSIAFKIPVSQIAAIEVTRNAGA